MALDYIVLFGLLPFLVLLLLQVPAYYFLVRPLRELSQTVARIHGGNLADPVPDIDGPKEIVELNRGIEKMRSALNGLTLDLQVKVAVQTAAVEQRNRQLDLVLENMERGVIMYDPNGNVAFCNHQILELFGLSEEEIYPGTTIREVLTQVADRCVRPPGMTEADLIDMLKGTGGGTVQDFTLPFHNGRTIHVLYKPIENGGFVHTCEDITERLNYEEALRSSKHEAEEANKAKSQFLANMSHELRTPLNAIIGFSEVILDGTIGTIENPKIRDYLEDLHECGRHLLALINDILDLSKAEAGRLEVEWQSVNTAKVLEESIRFMSDTARRQRIKLVSEVEEDLPHIWSNTRRLRQILLNLLSNAIKFTREDGRVMTPTRLDATGDVLLTVTDTGIGMTQQELGQAFRPFEQIESSLSRRYQGTGLGLSLTQRLVELLSGQMTVESEPGKGARVTVRFTTSDFPMTGEAREAI